MVQGFQGVLETRFCALAKDLAEGMSAAASSVERSTKGLGEFQRERLDRMEQGQRAALEDVGAKLKDVRETAAADQAKARDLLTERLEQVRRDGEARQAQMREALSAELAKLRAENTTELDKMRATVDEKLQSTLDQRLDANFKQVSERLESVQRGLGEMQTLATGVGDLKRVLTNVRARGTWGEVQLGALLEDSLTVDSVREPGGDPAPEPGAGGLRRAPAGHDEKGQVWLPIDCKFPHEDYARLLAAQEAADPVAVEGAGKALERAIAAQAKSVATSTSVAPHTTDFAYLYLPTEGLFAEIVRREGFTAELRAKYKVEVAGPSTLTALLNSLRVGFRSLQIQKKSSEVWVELGKVKTAFENYGDALGAVDKKLDEAKNKVSQVADRHRQVLNSLRKVDAPEVADNRPPLLALAHVEPEEAAA
jgi:DNA recombination protein RmuC